MKSDKLAQIVMQELSSGELALELNRRLAQGQAIRITTKGVRVTHSKYLDRLCSADAIDNALRGQLTEWKANGLRQTKATRTSARNSH